MSVRIEELDVAGIDRHASELAQLLLDAHAANMALGLAAPLNRERAADAWDELRGVILAAFEDDTVVGAVCLTRATAENGRHRAEVQKLVVRTDQRGNGIGTALLDAVAERAKADGITLLWLTTHAGTRSDHFYERTGWTRVGEIPGYSLLPSGSLAANAFFYREL
ncbi:MAG TPA: GNAT family N-acetyltransferase [Gaiellaceae bacterium]|nr:GNAT family N-acetyltransferase [Gaiellaceae bacterium]